MQVHKVSLSAWLNANGHVLQQGGCYREASLLSAPLIEFLLHLFSASIQPVKDWRDRCRVAVWSRCLEDVLVLLRALGSSCKAYNPSKRKANASI